MTRSCNLIIILLIKKFGIIALNLSKKTFILYIAYLNIMISIYLA